ncbi:MAG: ABC transporter permease [Prochlorothrix sp.]
MIDPWLAPFPIPQTAVGTTLLNPFEETLLPLGDWIEIGVEWLVDNFRWIFQAIRWPINSLLTQVENLFQVIPPLIFLTIVGLIAWQLAGRRIALLSLGCLTLVGLIGAWEESMTTLALVITAVVLCIVVGLPLGIWAASDDRAEAFLRPVLDAMQTLPAFVYLVPVVMLFGTGQVPGVIVTFIFAVPPLIRLTNIGIRQVPADVVEAARAFGSTPQQILWDVEIPLALPTILAGVNQALMLALSMVVIASLIAVEGLGQMVNRGIGRLDVGLASVGGIGIVLIAIMLDRITQAVGQPGATPDTWLNQGPIGGIRSLLRSSPLKAPSK